MNRHRPFLALTLLGMAVFGALVWHGRGAAARARQDGAGQRALVRTLGLTDLALWTEARYTRHPSQADHFTPFQEFPSALEHFPAGSILAPAAPASRPAQGS